MYLRSNSALPVSFGSTAPLDIVGVATFVYQFVSASLCRILYDLKLEVETAWMAPRLLQQETQQLKRRFIDVRDDILGCMN